MIVPLNSTILLLSFIWRRREVPFCLKIVYLRFLSSNVEKRRISDRKHLRVGHNIVSQLRLLFDIWVPSSFWVGLCWVCILIRLLQWGNQLVACKSVPLEGLDSRVLYELGRPGLPLLWQEWLALVGYSTSPSEVESPSRFVPKMGRWLQKNWTLLTAPGCTHFLCYDVYCWFAVRLDRLSLWCWFAGRNRREKLLCNWSD